MRLPRTCSLCVGLVLIVSAAQLAVASMAQPGEDYDDDDGPPPKDIGACIRFLGLTHCAPEETAIAADLVQNGPSSSAQSTPGKVSVVGFVRNRWPLVVAFQPEPGTLTVLRVKLYHRRWLLRYYEVAYQRVLDPDGSGGPQEVVVDHLDLNEAESPGPGIRVARYDIRSFRLRNGVPILRYGRRVRAPVTVFGIGAGPHAVGSSTLRDARFEPPATLQIPRGRSIATIRYSYALERNYPRVSSMLRICQPLCKNDGRLGSAMSRSANPHIVETWSIDHLAVPGRYEIDVRAWLDCYGATGALAISQCGDNGAWALGTARSVVLRR